MQKQNTEATLLLWTGGWDSTFRLLHLLIVQKEIVQPLYLIDSTRQSTIIEIQTMNRIKTLLFKQYPETEGRLLPTIYKDIQDTRHHDNLREMYRRIKPHKNLGIQFLWLAEFCVDNGLHEIELSIEKGGNVYDLIHLCVSEINFSHSKNYKIDETKCTPDEYGLFRFYRFPLLFLTKLDMQSIAANENFKEMMDTTWFCHRPRGVTPCGVCNPCSTAIKEGLGYRIPLSGRIRHMLQMKARIKERQKNFPTFLKTFRRSVKKS